MDNEAEEEQGRHSIFLDLSILLFRLSDLHITIIFLYRWKLFICFVNIVPQLWRMKISSERLVEKDVLPYFFAHTSTRFSFVNWPPMTTERKQGIYANRSIHTIGIRHFDVNENIIIFFFSKMICVIKHAHLIVSTLTPLCGIKSRDFCFCFSILFSITKILEKHCWKKIKRETLWWMSSLLIRISRTSVYVKKTLSFANNFSV